MGNVMICECGGAKERRASGYRAGVQRFRWICPACEAARLRTIRSTRSGFSSGKNAIWKAANPEKCRAHKKVENALASGRLIRQPCHCGKKAEAHHDDYGRPLDVLWLCRAHHAARHRENPPAAMQAALFHSA